MASDTHRAIDAVWRIESAKLIAGLTRIVRDVGLAEDLAQWMGTNEYEVMTNISARVPRVYVSE